MTLSALPRALFFHRPGPGDYRWSLETYKIRSILASHVIAKCLMSSRQNNQMPVQIVEGIYSVKEVNPSRLEVPMCCTSLESIGVVYEITPSLSMEGIIPTLSSSL
ncbi:hypothetical protein ElyMa_001476100 [Elysia marginata]|uniref:Uncharacterized protein n=1 Tax=Elysia marginata TaxID=1093978 RepID=A0AAV4J7P4_9GAST|nr:hypothetical protein ElyMa_001476100 [Elysia marginata]